MQYVFLIRSSAGCKKYVTMRTVSIFIANLHAIFNDILRTNHVTLLCCGRSVASWQWASLSWGVFLNSVSAMGSTSFNEFPFWVVFCHITLERSWVIGFCWHFCWTYVATAITYSEPSPWWAPAQTNWCNRLSLVAQLVFSSMTRIMQPVNWRLACRIPCCRSRSGLFSASTVNVREAHEYVRAIRPCNTHLYCIVVTSWHCVLYHKLAIKCSMYRPM